MFTAALFTIAKTWRQPVCPLTDEWLKKIWYIYTVKYHSVIKNEIMPIEATWMDLERIIFNEVSQTNIIWYHLYMESKTWYKWKVKVKVAQSCPTLYDPKDNIAHGILQARILEWVAFPFSSGSFQLRDRTQVSHIAGGFFTTWATREAQKYCSG